MKKFPGCMITSLWRHQPRAFYVKISKKFEFSKTFYSKKEAVKKKRKYHTRKRIISRFWKSLVNHRMTFVDAVADCQTSPKNEKRGPLIYGKKPLIMSENHQTSNNHSINMMIPAQLSHNFQALCIFYIPENVYLRGIIGI